MGSIFVSDGDIGFDADCEKPVTGIPPGHYTIFGRDEGGGDATSAVDVRSGKQAEVMLAVDPTAVIHAKAIDVRTGVPVAGARCRALIPEAATGVLPTGRIVRSGSDGSFTLTLAKTQLLLNCEDARYAREDELVDLTHPSDPVIVRMVRLDPDAVDIGALVRRDNGGATVMAVADEAAAAGLRPGDFIEAVDGIPLAGMGRRTIVALVSRVARGQTVHWRVRRGNKMMLLAVTASG
jgi:hypothetical protein